MRRRPLRAVFALLGLLVAAACGGESPKPRAQPPAKPSIILVIMDTLRADSVAVGDAGPGPMPFLHRWANGATAFADALAPAAWTPQAMPTLLTGLSPPHHGCEGMAETSVPALPGAVVTFAERLKTYGYTTAAFTSGGFFAFAQGLYQGFDQFAEALDNDGPETCIATWQLNLPPGRPFFLVLHTYLPHDPYGAKDPKAIHSAGVPKVPASPTLERTLGDPGRSPTSRIDPDTMRECAIEWITDGMARPANARLTYQRSASDFIPALRTWLSGGYVSEPAHRAAVEGRLRKAYFDGLGLADGVMERLFKALEATKLPPGTITVFTSDHGEAFGEDDHLLHERYLHDEIVRIPLLIHAPGKMPAGAVIRGTCGLADVTPTLLELAGLPPSPGIDGRSLVPLAHGKASGHPVVATADRYDPVGGGHRLVREVRVRDARRVWSYVYDVATGERLSEHVFDLTSDPKMKKPLAVSAVEWPDDELCRLVTSTRDDARTRFGLEPLGSLCKPPR